MGQTIGQPKRTVIALNASGGAYVSIPCSRFARYVEISECPPDGGSFTGGNYAPQGTNFTLPDDGFVHVNALLPGDVMPIGDRNFPRDRGGQPGWTDPTGAAVGATIYCKMKSATITATQVQVLEWS